MFLSYMICFQYIKFICYSYQRNMKNILFHPEAIRAFNNGARRNISGTGSQLQTLAYLLGHEDNDGNIKITELIFPYQDGSRNSVFEIGKSIKLFKYKIFFVLFLGIVNGTFFRCNITI